MNRDFLRDPTEDAYEIRIAGSYNVFQSAPHYSFRSVLGNDLICCHGLGWSECDDIVCVAEHIHES